MGTIRLHNAAKWHSNPVALWSVDEDGLDVSIRAQELINDGVETNEAIKQACSEFQEESEEEQEEAEADLEFMKERYLLAVARSANPAGLAGLSRRELVEIAALNPAPVCGFQNWLRKLDKN